ncbi:MAG: DUF1800 family protein [Alteromonadaceae bacterium]|nr:DUF1800 family protein [Alteromonadaceae bacterium]
MKSSCKFSLITLMASLLSACGGSSTEDNDSTPLPTVEKSQISISAFSTLAIEKSNQFAKFNIERTGASTALSLQFTTSGNADTTKGSASVDDFKLVYSDGGDVGNTLELAINQNSRVIEVHPVQDNLHEVPETLTLTLTNSSNYSLTSNNSIAVVITDANNDSENAKVFLGVFSPQNDAVTTGSGLLSLILSGDNESALLSYNFANLGSVQTDQHIHLAPSGTMIKDIEFTGTISNYAWDLAPGGIFVDEQSMLDTLFNGEFFLNIHTANYPAGEISARMIYDANIEPPAETELGATDIDRDIIRFLTQATFGATPETYQVLRQQIDDDGSNRLQVYSNWIEQQFTLPATSLLTLTDASVPLFVDENPWFIRRDAFWPIALYGRDQLRQRMTFALSEILVIGDEVKNVRNAYRGTAHYWDQLAGNAFTSYRKTIGDASLHPIMGTWLSHLRNQKADVEQGFYPDENYAREIMQLFSFGLVHRQVNGAIKLGDDNLPIATYDNDVIKAMAEVFTGLGFSHKNSNANKVSNGNFFLKDNFNQYQYRWTEPMKFFANYHEFAEKTLFTSQGITLTIPQSNESSSSAAQAELDTVLDALISHESTAPVISRKLIQRFVSSNPSADYIERVANIFGKTGDLKAVIRAILLDKEARNPAVISSPTFGKLKEPVLQFSALMRLLEAGSNIPLGSGSDGDTQGLDFSFADQYDAGASLMRIGEGHIGQQVLGSPSVFNFFLPDFAPTGALASNSLVSPELQLYTESQLFNTFNVYNKLISSGLYRNSAKKYSDYSANELKVTLNKDILPNIWNQAEGDNLVKAAAVVDYLDFYLSAGQLKLSTNSDTRQIFIDAIAAAKAGERFDLAIYGASISPEFLIQK